MTEKNKQQPGLLPRELRPTNRRAVMDSGMVSNFTKSQHQKPQFNSFYKSIQQKFTAAFSKHSTNTSEQGSSQFASPSIAQMSLWNLRYERRAVIKDTNLMFFDDPRIRKAVIKYAREAVRDGCTIVVSGRARGSAGSRFNKAVDISMHIQQLVNPLLESWACMSLVDGELFVQACVSDDGKEIVTAKRMPTASMERNTDDTDSFTDPLNAFSQVDTLTNATVANFPLALMHHMRWNLVDGDRYGTSDLIAVRRAYRLNEMMMEAQIRRRMARASQKILWSIGTKENMGQPQDIENFKEMNGFNEGRREALNPMEVSRDFFSNGGTDAKAIEGDQTVHFIDDIDFQQNIMLAGLCTPGPLFNLASTGINRDILADMRAEWLKDTKAMSAKLTEVIAWLFELALLLAGIDPRFVQYSIQFSESSIETPSEIVDRTLKAYNNGYGQGLSFVWMPLITKEQAIQNLAPLLGVADVKSMIAQVDAERAAIMANIAAMTPPAGQDPTPGSGAKPAPTPQKTGKDDDMDPEPFEKYTSTAGTASPSTIMFGEGQDPGPG